MRIAQAPPMMRMFRAMRAAVVSRTCGVMLLSLWYSVWDVSGNSGCGYEG